MINTNYLTNQSRENLDEHQYSMARKIKCYSQFTSVALCRLKYFK